MQNENKKFPRWEDLPEIELYMDQLVSYVQKYLTQIFVNSEIELTQSMVNNYVKIKIMPPPTKKRYSKEHISLLFVICALKQVLSINEITLILTNFDAIKTQDGYNRFCEAQEMAIISAQGDIKKANGLLRSEVALNMAVCAAASKAQALNLLKPQV